MAAAQSPAAVVRPLTRLSRVTMIVPAPMKPMPLTTCAAIRLGSSRSPSCVARKPSNPYCDTIIIRALPSATRKWVRNPASLTRYSRSSPITVPQRPATHNLNIKSHSISIVPRFLFPIKYSTNYRDGQTGCRRAYMPERPDGTTGRHGEAFRTERTPLAPGNVFR